MPSDLTSLILLLVTSAVTFTAARLLSRRFRERRRHQAEAQKRAGESRQVRRARERRSK
jgi:hypothetical protein